MKKLLREPLFHFLLIGAGLFLLFGLTKDKSGDTPQRIVVSQSQVQQLSDQFSRTWMRPPTKAELDELINNHVRNEVYYREAVAMGLDQNDPQIRRRMRLKLEYLLEDLSATESPSDEILTAFMLQNPDLFQEQPRVSFQQVYLNPDKRPDIKTDAMALLARLKQDEPPETLGDPTMIPAAYTLATPAEIARQFGEGFAGEVVALPPGIWAGPVYSGLGGHLILITDHKAGRLLELAEIRDQVERDYLAQRRQALKDQAYAKILEGYEVVIESLEASGRPSGKAIASIRSEETEQ